MNRRDRRRAAGCIDSFRAIIEWWPTQQALADELGVSDAVVRAWKAKIGIPAWYWQALLETKIARRNRLTPAVLVRLAAKTISPDDGLKAAIKAAGGMESLARALGINSVAQWKRVPAERIVQIERLTNLPRNVLRPDLFVHDLRIDQIGFSVRVENALLGRYSAEPYCYNYDPVVIETVGQLITFTEAELLRLPNFGAKSLKEVQEFLAQHGLHLDGPRS